jgi:hypothetical protein
VFPPVSIGESNPELMAEFEEMWRQEWDEPVYRSSNESVLDGLIRQNYPSATLVEAAPLRRQR